MKTMTNPQTYWALEEETERLALIISERVEKFSEAQRHHPFAQRILRNFKYYYNLAESGRGVRELGVAGKDGQFDIITLNHTRSLMSTILTMATRDKPSPEVIAVNAEQKSLDQASLAGPLLEYYDTEKQVGTVLYDVAEASLIHLVSYAFITWNPDLGQQVQADPETGSVFYQGDLAVEHRSIFDVTYDASARDWNDVQWVIVRSWKNKWDLATQFPEFRDEIISAESRINPDEEFTTLDWGNHDDEDSDMVPVYEFFHKKTPSVPDGRYLLVAAEKPLTPALPLPYEDLPVERMAAGEVLGTTCGYSPAIDIQGCQEAVNALASLVLTNNTRFGAQYVWCDPDHPISDEQLDGGLTVLKCKVEPKPINLVKSSTETVPLMQMLVQQMQLMTGISDVVRGVLPSSQISGTALALLESKSIQYMSGIIKAYYDLVGRVYTKMLRTLRDFADSDRVISIAGKYNRPRQLSFRGDDLSNIDRVIVKFGNAMARTQAGKLEMADRLAKNNWVTTGQEYLNVMERGILEPVHQADLRQIDRIRIENEYLTEGKPVKVLATDNHVLHMREHAGELCSPDIVDDQEKSSAFEAHVLEHYQMFLNPEIQQLQKLLGYPMMPPALSTPQPGYEPMQPDPAAGGMPGGNPLPEEEMPLPGAEPIPDVDVQDANLPTPPPSPEGPV